MKLHFKTYGPINTMASLHQDDCAHLKMAGQKKGIHIIPVTGPDDEQVKDLEERGYPVRMAPCLKKKEITTMKESQFRKLVREEIRNVMEPRTALREWTLSDVELAMKKAGLTHDAQTMVQRLRARMQKSGSGSPNITLDDLVAVGLASRGPGSTQTQRELEKMHGGVKEGKKLKVSTDPGAIQTGKTHKMLRGEAEKSVKKEADESNAFMVNIPANVYDGKYYDYRTVHYIVKGVKTEKEAIRWVNTNKDKVLAALDRKKLPNGKRFVAAPIEKNVFFKDDYNVRPTTVYIAGKGVGGPEEGLREAKDETSVQREKRRPRSWNASLESWEWRIHSKGSYWQVNDEAKVQDPKPVWGARALSGEVDHFSDKAQAMKFADYTHQPKDARDSYVRGKFKGEAVVKKEARSEKRYENIPQPDGTELVVSPKADAAHFASHDAARDYATKYVKGFPSMRITQLERGFAIELSPGQDKFVAGRRKRNATTKEDAQGNRWVCMECHHQSGQPFKVCPKCGSREVENMG